MLKWKLIIYASKLTKATFQDGKHFKMTSNWRAMKRWVHLLDSLNVFISYLCRDLKLWATKTDNWTRPCDDKKDHHTDRWFTKVFTVMQELHWSVPEKVELSLKARFLINKSFYFTMLTYDQEVPFAGCLRYLQGHCQLLIWMPPRCSPSKVLRALAEDPGTTNMLKGS